MKFTTIAAAAVAAGMMAGGASAATVDLCNTGPLKGCTVSAEGLPETEAIAKYDFEESKFTGNPNFSSVTASNFNFGGVALDDDDEVSGGTITYTLLNDSDPGMTAFSTKRGSTETLFFGADIGFADGVFTFDLGSGDNAVSNFVIYDNFDNGDTTVIPLPAAGWLMLAGLGGLAALRRRKTV